jgi:cytochrome c-type biogenesis protein CcmH/NrfF
MRRPTAILLALLLASALAPATTALAANASLPDIEDEVMCTICGTTLQLSNSPQAERERVFINELIAQGKTKEEIKSALVDEYGPEVLAVPSDDGFDLVGGWILPALGVLAGAAIVAAAAWRWRRSQRRDDEEQPPFPTPAGEDEQRLQKDLDLYDR